MHLDVGVAVRRQDGACRVRGGRVTETAHWLEWQNRADPVLAEPFPLREGALVIPDRPGCGVEWDEDAVTRYRTA